jgi:hypothetical protein
VPSTLLSTGNTRTDEQQTLLLQLGGPSDRVRVVRVSTIDDDVTLLEVGLELLDEGVDGGTGLDEEDDLSGSLQVGTELLDGVGTNDVLACGKGGRQPASIPKIHSSTDT